MDDQGQIRNHISGLSDKLWAVESLKPFREPAAASAGGIFPDFQPVVLRLADHATRTEGALATQMSNILRKQRDVKIEG